MVELFTPVPQKPFGVEFVIEEIGLEIAEQVGME